MKRPAKRIAASKAPPRGRSIPPFEGDDQERDFWARHDSTDYLDATMFKPALFPNLKPSLKTISVRLPESLIESLKVLAHREDVPYQSLLKVLLSEAVRERLKR
jgi:predicted DNA binding CopG/RHH family protein